MASDQQAAELDSASPFRNPWPLILGSFGVALVAFFLRLSLQEGTKEVEPEWAFPRLLLILTALLAAAGAVWIRPRHAGVLALAAAVALLSYMAMDNTWDSAKMVVAVLTILATLASVVMALPLVLGPEAGRIVGRTIVSLFILYHFGGILVAITSVNTPSGTTPWVSSTLWTYCYRPYLQFMYLTNAYHFYSPEPGPAFLIWARVEYADKSSRWVKIPNRDEHHKDPLGQEYYRRLSLTESINQLEPATILPPEVIQNHELARRNYKAGYIPLDYSIPLHLQYRQPKLESKKMLSCVARFIALNYKHPTQPETEMTSVKIYRVVHRMLHPAQMVRYDHEGRRINRIQFIDKDGTVIDQEVSPLLPTLFQPYYQGEYDRNGNLLDPTDTLLYWLIPIVPRYENKLPSPFKTPFQPPSQEMPVLVGWDDYLKLHAGSDPWGDILQ